MARVWQFLRFKLQEMALLVIALLAWYSVLRFLSMGKVLVMAVAVQGAVLVASYLPLPLTLTRLGPHPSPSALNPAKKSASKSQ